MNELQEFQPETTNVNGTPVIKKTNFISVVLLLLILAVIPLTVVYLGAQTRQQIKAAEQCKTPSIPDPSECAGGQWKLYKNEASCIRFRCELK